MTARWRFPLYLRIWTAVLAAVLLLSLAFGWLLQASNQQIPEREVIIRDEEGEVLGRAMTRPMRTPDGLEFAVAMHDGKTLIVQLPPRPHAPGAPPPGRGWMMRGPGGLFWMLGLVAVAVAVGSFPIVRRMTQRLERLERGVQQWGEGDLSVRLADEGNDEVAALARRFNHAAERVERLLRTHKSLLANASHELRSPLARIRMGLELMGAEAPAALQDEIRRNIAELDQLVDEILLASRLDSREADMGTVETVDLTGLVAEECAHTGADLATGPEGRAILVQGVPKLLRRAVRNLLENARRYGQHAVDVELGREGGAAVLRVRDRGPGVPPGERERIFEPFYRLPGASERHGGVGLGLALVRSIAERHHGRAWCEDQPGGGACFVIRIPCESN